MRKARLGFEIYSTDDELLVEEDVDFERKEKDRKWASRQKELARKLKCYNKNKDKYNAQRREHAASITSKYHSAKIGARRRAQEWELTEDQWAELWINAGWVIIPGTITPSNPLGERRTAFFMRGPNKLTNTMMARKDLALPWTVDNCHIIFRGEPLQGSEYHAESIRT